MNEWVDTQSSEKRRKEGQEQPRKEETERPFTIRPICPKTKKTLRIQALRQFPGGKQTNPGRVKV